MAWNFGQKSMMQAGIQGAQNTSRQENMQRQALFQNIMGAMDDSAWLMQHFPNFYGWNAQGGGGGGYEAGTIAPMMPAASNFNAPSEGREESSGYSLVGGGQGSSSGGRYNPSPIPNYSGSGYTPQSQGGLTGAYGRSQGSSYSNIGRTSTGVGYIIER